MAKLGPGKKKKLYQNQVPRTLPYVSNLPNFTKSRFSNALAKIKYGLNEKKNDRYNPMYGYFYGVSIIPERGSGWVIENDFFS